jgi:hypothetical protein
MKWIKGISIRIKFILILVTITTAMLAVYSFFALNDFQSDKIAYVFESTLSESRSTSRQIQSELNFVLEKTEAYLNGYTMQTKKFSRSAKRAFERERSIAALWSYHYDNEKGAYRKFDKIGDDGFGIIDDKGWAPYFLQIVEDAIVNKITIRTFDANKEQWIMGLRFQPKLDEQPSVALVLVKSASFSDSFTGSTLSDALLINGNSDVIIEPFEANYLEKMTDIQAAVEKPHKSSRPRLAPIPMKTWKVENG